MRWPYGRGQQRSFRLRKQNKLRSLERGTVSEIGSHDGYVGLDRMCHDVDTGSGGKSLRLCHHVVRVHDCHIRKELIVCQRILDPSVGIRDDRERCDFGTCTGGSRDGYEVSLPAHFRILVDTLPDIHEVHGHVGEVRIRVLVEHPHDLGCVHRGTAAECDDDIRLKGAHLRCACERVLQSRIRLHIREACMDNPHGIKLVFDRLRIAVLVKEAVCYDKCALLVHDRAELIQRDRHAALLEINLFRCAEPEHILSPLCDCLDIDEVQDAYIVGYGVPAVGAAAQGQGGKELEVVEIADTTL